MLVSKRPSNTRSEAARAASMSPYWVPKLLTMLSGRSSCSTGAPSFRASSAVSTNGSTSYSTSMRCRAFSAVRASTATTAATASPTNLALSVRIRRSATSRWAGSMDQGCPAVGNFTLGRSAGVITASTPGRALARLTSMRFTRAWAWGLRSTLPTSMSRSK